MIRSFNELSKRKDEPADLIRDVFGEECVGSFGVGMTPTPTRRIKRKRRQPVESDITSDEYSADVASSGIVKDITISKLLETLALRLL